MKCEICGGVLSTYTDELNLIHHSCPYCGIELEGTINIKELEEMDVFGLEDMYKVWETL